MTGWLAAWDQPEMSELEGHDMSSMDGMMSADDMDELGTLKGAEFDAAWLTMMIAHHEGAVKMADEVKANGENADVATLALGGLSAVASHRFAVSPGAPNALRISLGGTIDRRTLSRALHRLAAHLWSPGSAASDIV